MINRKTLYAVFIALATAPEFNGPCRAQDPAADIPVLKQHIARDWIYFAAARDNALIFETPPRDASNVWIAVERSTVNRRVLANTEVWTDNRGRLHTVSVLKLQLEYNAYLQDEVRAWGPSTTGAIPVAETGILDHTTLAIPYSKLAPRARRIIDRLTAEDAAAESLSIADPSAAVIKKKYTAYLWEKAWAATARLTELNRAVFAVPTAMAGEEAPISQTDAVSLRGLRGLEISSATANDLKLVSQGSGEIRFVSAGGDAFQPERFIMEVVDPQGMTPAIAADLKEKTAVAEKAVILAEYACRQMLNPPCP